VRFLKRELTLFRLLKERVGEQLNIVRLHDVYLDQPPFYVEMDYVDGADLRTWCQEAGGIEAVDLETRLEIVVQAADGLQAAHDAGIIHRDIKPGNILVQSMPSRAGSPLPVASRIGSEEQRARDCAPYPHGELLTVKLTDFGIGQVVSEEALQGITRAGFTETVAGSSSSKTGTQLYMAPELLAGKPASIRSDIYSLGVVFYQLIVADFSRPLTTDWWKHVSEPLLREDLERCFAGNPQDRFAGASQLARRLRGLPERRTEQARRQAEEAALKRSSYRKGVLRTAAAAALIILVVAILAIVAGVESKRAKEQSTAAKNAAELAKVQRSRAEAGEYAAKLNLIQQAWEHDNVKRVRELLEETDDYPERGFEWYYWQRQTHLELKTLRALTGSLNAVAVSPQEAPALFFPRRSGSINAVAVSPDGQLIAMLAMIGRSRFGRAQAALWSER
jgi:hypothetical protein